MIGRLLPILLLVGGCCTNAGSSATCARKAVSGMYLAIGAVDVMGMTCDATALAQGKAGDDSGAAATMSKCVTMNKALHVSEDTALGAAEAIDAGEKIGAKDYSAAVAPLLSSGCSLAKAASEVSPKVPVVIPCGGGS